MDVTEDGKKRESAINISREGIFDLFLGPTEIPLVSWNRNVKSL